MVDGASWILRIRFIHAVLVKTNCEEVHSNFQPIYSKLQSSVPIPVPAELSELLLTVHRNKSLGILRIDKYSKVCYVKLMQLWKGTVSFWSLSKMRKIPLDLITCALAQIEHAAVFAQGVSPNEHDLSTVHLLFFFSWTFHNLKLLRFTFIYNKLALKL